jgi:nucleoside-triphosphatase THEP1
VTIIVVTGAPGVGKTTAVIRVARALKERGVKVGGIVSRELRSNSMRITLLSAIVEKQDNATKVINNTTGYMFKDCY